MNREIFNNIDHTTLYFSHEEKTLVYNYHKKTHSIHTNYFKPVHSNVNRIDNQNFMTFSNRKYAYWPMEQFQILITLLQDYNQKLIHKHNLKIDNQLIIPFLTERCIKAYPFLMHHLTENDKRQVEKVFQNYLKTISIEITPVLINFLKDWKWALPNTVNLVEDLCFELNMIS